jgi:hypothetical protein
VRESPPTRTQVRGDVFQIQHSSVSRDRIVIGATGGSSGSAEVSYVYSFYSDTGHDAILGGMLAAFMRESALWPRLRPLAAGIYMAHFPAVAAYRGEYDFRSKEHVVLSGIR